MIEIINNNNNKETDLPLFKHDVYIEEKFPDEWATTKQACRDTYVVTCFLPSTIRIEDIIWPRRDGKILFEREEKFRISKRPCNVLFIT